MNKSNPIYVINKWIHGTNEDGSINNKSLTVLGLFLSFAAVFLGVIALVYIPEQQRVFEKTWFNFIVLVCFWFWFVISSLYILMETSYLFYTSRIKEKRPLKEYIGTGQEHVLLPLSEYKLGEVAFIVSLMFYLFAIGFGFVAIAIAVVSIIEGAFNDSTVHGEKNRTEKYDDTSNQQ